MFRTLTLAAVAATALALPVQAGIPGVSTMRLTFPETAPQPDTTQGCFDPTSLAPEACEVDG